MSEQAQELIRLLLCEIDSISENTQLSIDDRLRLMRAIKVRIESIAQESGVAVHIQIVIPEPMASSSRSKRIVGQANPEMARVAADAVSYRSTKSRIEHPDGRIEHHVERQIQANKLVNETFKGLSGTVRSVGNAALSPFKFVVGICVRVGKGAVDVVIKGRGSGKRSQ